MNARLRRWWFGPASGGAMLGAALALCLAVMVIAIVLAVRESNEWSAWCQSQGGHVVTDDNTSVGTGVGANGQPVVVVVPNATSYCLSADGRVLGVR